MRNGRRKKSVKSMKELAWNAPELHSLKRVPDIIPWANITRLWSHTRNDDNHWPKFSALALRQNHVLESWLSSIPVIINHNHILSKFLIWLSVYRSNESRDSRLTSCNINRKFILYTHFGQWVLPSRYRISDTLKHCQFWNAVQNYANNYPLTVYLIMRRAIVRFYAIATVLVIILEGLAVVSLRTEWW